MTPVNDALTGFVATPDIAPKSSDDIIVYWINTSEAGNPHRDDALSMLYERYHVRATKHLINMYTHINDDEANDISLLALINIAHHFNNKRHVRTTKGSLWPLVKLNCSWGARSLMRERKRRDKCCTTRSFHRWLDGRSCNMSRSIDGFMQEIVSLCDKECNHDAALVAEAMLRHVIEDEKGFPGIDEVICRIHKKHGVILTKDKVSSCILYIRKHVLDIVTK